MLLRGEFVMLASQEGANVRALCGRYGISAQTGYKWLGRAGADPGEEFADRSRRPHSSPARTPGAVEAKVLALRAEHPRWGGRKLARRLRDLGEPRVPAPSTITEILRRHGRLDAREAGKHRALIRFERAVPNELWQMDFKGHFGHDAGRCHPLTVLDDCSRFSLCLEACADQRGATVMARLVASFERYGLPRAMVVDNGSPWGNGPGDAYTPLVVWLLRLGIRVSHSRPYHPQTLGKDERFHRSLKAEVLQGRRFRDLGHCQQAFAAWRQVYNLERPHEALDMAVPASRYQPSPRAYPATLMAIEYAAGDRVRKVQQGGRVAFMGRTWRLPKAFRGYSVAFRPTTKDGVWNVFFMTHKIAEIDLRLTEDHHRCVNHVPEHPSTLSPV